MAKGVMLTEHNLVSLVYCGLQISTVYDTCLSILPYHHTYEGVTFSNFISTQERGTPTVAQSLK